MATPNAVFPVHYLGSTRYYAALIQSNSFAWEVCEHYPKQSYRNRCVIYGANGPLTLSIPIARNGGRVPIKEKRIAYDEPWQHHHWRSFESAYRSSPYFEFFEDQLKPLYQKKFDFLVDFNLELHTLICKWLSLPLNATTTSEYSKELGPELPDLRNAFPAQGPKARPQTPEYIQVFGDKYGFLSDLSIVDLLFNQGPAGADFLRQLDL